MNDFFSLLFCYIVELAFLVEKCYDTIMYNWSTDTTELKKNPRLYAAWLLEQSINFGLQGKKLKVKELKKYWNKLNLDPARKKFLELLLYEKDSHQKSNRRS